jgi:hypothetical protein
VIDEHAAAVLALLNGIPAPSPAVYDGKVPDPAPDPRLNPYVLVYTYSTDPEPDFEAKPWQFEMTAVCHCVGGNAQAARMVADLVRTALLGVQPTVVGRSCAPIRRVDSQPPQRDESTGELWMDQIDSYTIRSLPG